MTSQTKRLVLVMVVGLACVPAVQPLSEDGHTPPHPHPHARTVRQLHRILDPFGLLGKAGEAVSGAVEDLGKRLDEGAQHMGRVVQQGAATLDSAFKSHVQQVQAGLEEAGKVANIVGEDLVDSVSSLVSNHLQGPDEEEDEAMRREGGGGAARREGIIDGFFRMFGINSSQVGLMALNVLIFLAEMITSSLIGEDLNEIPEAREGETSVLSWFLSGSPSKIDAMLREAQDPALPRSIIEKLQRATGDDTACVQLLVCKLSPVVWGLQRTVKDNTHARALHPDKPQPGILQTLYNALPPLNDFVTFSESCEKQFPVCPLIHLAELGL